MKKKFFTPDITIEQDELWVRCKEGIMTCTDTHKTQREALRAFLGLIKKHTKNPAAYQSDRINARLYNGNIHFQYESDKRNYLITKSEISQEIFIAEIQIWIEDEIRQGEEMINRMKDVDRSNRRIK